MFACNVDLDVCAHVHLHACVYLFICICIGLVGKGIQTKAHSQPMHHWQFWCEQICRSGSSSRTPWRQNTLKGCEAYGLPQEPVRTAPDPAATAAGALKVRAPPPA